MAIFDQKGQTVTYQYNTAGDLIISSMNNIQDVHSALSKITQELGEKKQKFPDEIENIDSAKKQIELASKEIKDNKKEQAQDSLSSAKSIIEGTKAAAGLTASITQIIDTISKIL